MKQILALVVSVYAQRCCPTACPSIKVQQSCCTKCPPIDTCFAAPVSSRINLVADGCSKTKMEWKPLQSCAPVRNTQIQCQDNYEQFQPVPNVKAPQIGASFTNLQFMRPPFNLKKGDYLSCRLIAENKNGYGQWSKLNHQFQLGLSEECPLEPPSASNCRCQKSCKLTGCGGCCTGHWPESKKNEPLVDPALQNMTLTEGFHRHEYCHIHPEDMCRKVKQTIWKDVPYMMKKTVIRPMNVTRLETVMRKTMHLRPTTRFVNETVKERKIVVKPVTRNITTYITVETKEMVPVPRMRKVKKIQKTTEYRQKIRSEKRIIMKPVNFTRTQITWESVPEMQKLVRIIKKRRLVKRRIGSDLTEVTCPCFEEQCGCVGKDNCTCCFPKCGCAPEIHMQNVDVLLEELIPEHYEQMRIVEKPTEKTVRVDTFEPIEQWHNYTEQIPIIIEKEVWVDIPYMVMEEQIVKTKKKVVKQVTKDEETEVLVDREVKKPITEMVEVFFDEPVDSPITVVSEVAVTEFIPKTRKVPVIVTECLPDPPCHWHEISHQHGVVTGDIHKHDYDA